jgi:hypothetical protein
LPPFERFGWMTPNDDISGETPASRTEKLGASHGAGPESESRGGPEAPEDADQLTPPDARPVPDGRPGERAALPEGSLPNPYLGPQGDENRDPPADAPAATFPAETVEDARRSAGQPGTAQQ